MNYDDRDFVYGDVDVVGEVRRNSNYEDLLSTYDIEDNLFDRVLNNAGGNIPVFSTDIAEIYEDYDIFKIDDPDKANAMEMAMHSLNEDPKYSYDIDTKPKLYAYPALQLSDNENDRKLMFGLTNTSFNFERERAREIERERESQDNIIRENYRRNPVRLTRLSGENDKPNYLLIRSLMPPINEKEKKSQRERYLQEGREYDLTKTTNYQPIPIFAYGVVPAGQFKDIKLGRKKYTANQEVKRNFPTDAEILKIRRAIKEEVAIDAAAAEQAEIVPMDRTKSLQFNISKGDLSDLTKDPGYLLVPK